jgi:hypothetical protein
MIFIWWKLKMSYHTAYPNGILKLLFAICFCIPSYVQQQLLSLDCQNFVQYKSLMFFLPILGTVLVQGFSFERGPSIF